MMNWKNTENILFAAWYCMYCIYIMYVEVAPQVKPVLCVIVPFLFQKWLLLIKY